MACICQRSEIFDRFCAARNADTGISHGRNFFGQHFKPVHVRITQCVQASGRILVLIQNFLDNFNACNAQGECAYTPKADYYEVDNGFVLEVELPGVKKEDLDVQVEKNIITVKATRARKDSKYTYERSFRLADDIDPENIKVSFENGVLTFSLAKKQQASARKLTVD